MLVLLTAAAVAFLALPPLLAILRRAEVIDHPSERSSHQRPTLRGGGLAVVLAVTVATGLGVRLGLAAGVAVLPAVLVLIGLAALGFREDVHGLSAGSRLRVQLLVSVLAGASVLAYGAPAWAAAVMVAAVVAYANAFNFMDGVNGISALNAVFAGLAYAAIGTAFDAVEVTIVGLAVAGAALGFLPFNVPAAKVFLGDSGSYALGGVVAVLAVQCLAAGAPLLLCVAPVSVYLVDTGWTLLSRHRRGQSLVTAHREHAYQRLAALLGNGSGGHVGAAASTVAVAALVTTMAYAGGESSAGTLVAGALGIALLVEYVAAPSAVRSPRSTRSPAAAPSPAPAAASQLARSQLARSQVARSQVAR